MTVTFPDGTPPVEREYHGGASTAVDGFAKAMRYYDNLKQKCTIVMKDHHGYMLLQMEVGSLNLAAIPESTGRDGGGILADPLVVNKVKTRNTRKQ